MTADNVGHMGEFGVVSLDAAWAVRRDSRRRPALPDELLDAARIPHGAELTARVADEGCVVLETRQPVKHRRRRRSEALDGKRSLSQELLDERRTDAGETVAARSLLSRQRARCRDCGPTGPFLTFLERYCHLGLTLVRHGHVMSENTEPTVENESIQVPAQEPLEQSPAAPAAAARTGGSKRTVVAAIAGAAAVGLLAVAGVTGYAIGNSHDGHDSIAGPGMGHVEAGQGQRGDMPGMGGQGMEGDGDQDGRGPGRGDGRPGRGQDGRGQDGRGQDGDRPDLMGPGAGQQGQPQGEVPGGPGQGIPSPGTLPSLPSSPAVQ